MDAVGVSRDNKAESKTTGRKEKKAIPVTMRTRKLNEIKGQYHQTQLETRRCDNTTTATKTNTKKKQLKATKNKRRIAIANVHHCLTPPGVNRRNRYHEWRSEEEVEEIEEEMEGTATKTATTPLNGTVSVMNVGSPSVCFSGRSFKLVSKSKKAKLGSYYRDSLAPPVVGGAGMGNPYIVPRESSRGLCVFVCLCVCMLLYCVCCAMVF